MIRLTSERRAHREGHFTTPDGADIYTQAWLPDGAPQAILLIVHGLGEHSGRYGNYVNYFVPRGYALYSFDTRGHGRSSGPRGHVERFDRYVEDIDRRAAEARDRIGRARRCLSSAHSLGSLMGLSYARAASRSLDGSHRDRHGAARCAGTAGVEAQSGHASSAA